MTVMVTWWQKSSSWQNRVKKWKTTTYCCYWMKRNRCLAWSRSRCPTASSLSWRQVASSSYSSLCWCGWCHAPADTRPPAHPFCVLLPVSWWAGWCPCSSSEKQSRRCTWPTPRFDIQSTTRAASLQSASPHPHRHPPSHQTSWIHAVTDVWAVFDPRAEIRMMEVCFQLLNTRLGCQLWLQRCGRLQISLHRPPLCCLLGSHLGGWPSLVRPWSSRLVRGMEQVWNAGTPYTGRRWAHCR